MKRPAWVLLVLFAAGVLAWAFDWPVKTVTITSTFGEYRGDHFHGGIDLGGGEQDVLPIAAGELVFGYEEGEDYSSVPVGMGSFAVLQHQEGVRSIYSHLKEGSLRKDVKVFNGGIALGKIGATGYSLGKHLHLAIIDSEMRTLINPLLVLPPLKDAQKPVIRELYLRQGRDLAPVKSGQTVRQGEAEVLCQLYDLREDVSFAWKLAPYKISLYQDGREVTRLLLDALRERPLRVEGSAAQTAGPAAAMQLVLLQSNRALQDVYESEWVFRLGQVKLVPGESTLSIFAGDYAGNETSRDFALHVVE